MKIWHDDITSDTEFDKILNYPMLTSLCMFLQQGIKNPFFLSLCRTLIITVNIFNSSLQCHAPISCSLDKGKEKNYEIWRKEKLTGWYVWRSYYLKIHIQTILHVKRMPWHSKATYYNKTQISMRKYKEIGFFLWDIKKIKTKTQRKMQRLQHLYKIIYSIQVTWPSIHYLYIEFCFKGCLPYPA